ncbi:ATP-binding cassette domain-containing protein [bacterium]|nr:MAG: ATP-binding cassette domain-containing protein [bacterium]
MAEPIIKIENLSYTYPSTTKALTDVSLDVYPGEYLAIVGANGAGKTTLCMFLNGVIPNVVGGRVSGTVQVCGMDTFEHHVYDIAQNVGLVLQDPESQLFSADVRSEIAFAAENRGVPREEIIERMQEVLKIVRLEAMASRLSDELSGGQKQRLAIAANLIVRPKILVADEPTSQLDPVGKEEVFSTLSSLNKDFGMTVVIASHDVDEIERYADRVIVLEHGSIILQGPPDKVFREVDTLDRMFVHVPDLARLGKSIILDGDQLLSLDVPKAAAQIKTWLGREKSTSGKAFEEPSASAPAANYDASKVDLAVEVKDLTYAYPGTSAPAISNMDFSIPKGQFVGIIGQNGGGKTTIMKCLVGLLKPSQGEIYLENKPLTGQKVGDIATQIGLILQNPDTQLFCMSVEEEIRFGLENLKLEPEEIERRTEESLKITGLGNYRQLYPFKLSLGDRRKVAVASIVAMRPQVLIFDEPLTGQDYKGRYELVNLAAELHHTGHTVIMISHDMELVARYTERTLVVGKGQLLLDAPTRDVFDHVSLLRETFIEPPEIIRLAQELRVCGLPSGLLSIDKVTESIQMLKKVIVPGER